MTKPELPIQHMDERHPGLTPNLAGTYHEAACVSLSANHSPPQDFELFNDEGQSITEVRWQPPDARCSRAWANRDDATRDGAYACAIAAVELLSGLYAIGRAETLTGADYYVAPVSEDLVDLEVCIRLEVSGTQSDQYEVRRRLSDKIKQARAGKSNLPAIAVVVGFRAKSIMMRSVDK
jgi:AraC-like DNA-binding protein